MPTVFQYVKLLSKILKMMCISPGFKPVLQSFFLTSAIMDVCNSPVFHGKKVWNHEESKYFPPVA